VRHGGRDITDEPIDFQPGDIDGLEIDLIRRLPVVEPCSRDPAVRHSTIG
jgi:hypothetical protein